MACTFTIKDTAIAATSFAEGRYGVSFHSGSPRVNIATYHPPGITGDYTSSDGEGTRNIRARIRYRAADRATLKGLMHTDLAAWTDNVFTIAGDDGKSYARCRLDNDQPRLIEDVRGVQKNSRLVQVIYEWSFTCYGEVT